MFIFHYRCLATQSARKKRHQIYLVSDNKFSTKTKKKKRLKSWQTFSSVGVLNAFDLNRKWHITHHSHISKCQMYLFLQFDSNALLTFFFFFFLHLMHVYWMLNKKGIALWKKKKCEHHDCGGCLYSSVVVLSVLRYYNIAVIATTLFSAGTFVCMVTKGPWTI